MSTSPAGDPRTDRNRRRTPRRVVTTTLLGATGLGVVAIAGVLPGAEASHLLAGPITVVNPANTAPLTSGGSTTSFRFNLPTGAACTGDSANAGYRIQSYLVPQSVDLDTLRFNSEGPVPAANEVRLPLFQSSGNNTGNPLIDEQTATAVPAGGPGPIIQPLPTFNFAVVPAGFLQPGTYNIGIACTLGPSSSLTQLDKYFNTTITLANDPNDPGMAKISFQFGGVTPPSTTSTTVLATTSTTLPPSTTSTTVPPSTTSTTVPPSTTSTTVPPSTTSTTVPPSTTSTTVPPSTTSTTIPSTTTTTTTPPPPPPPAEGYVLVAKDGGVFAPGGAGFVGTARIAPGDGILRNDQGRIIAASGRAIDSPVIAIASTPSRQGYWLVQANGGVIPIGDAANLGDLRNVSLAAPIVGAAATANGGGLYLAASDGGIFTLGSAPFKGSLGGVRLDRPIVGMDLDGDGSGYVLVAADGGVFTFDAGFRGSLGSTKLDQPIVGITVADDGGYVLVAADGGAFTYGFAFTGSLGGLALEAPIVGIAADPDGDGYWMAGADGGVFAFDALFQGSVAPTMLHAPISGITAL